jgi:hypothetical protein
MACGKFRNREDREKRAKTVSKFIFFNLFAAFLNLSVSFFNLFAALFNLSIPSFNLFVAFFNLSVSFFNLSVVLFNLFSSLFMTQFPFFPQINTSSTEHHLCRQTFVKCEGLNWNAGIRAGSAALDEFICCP